MPCYQVGTCGGCGGGESCDGSHALTVRVLNLADSSPVEGATVTLTSRPTGAAAPTTTTTDASGAWIYPLFYGGTYSGTVAYNGCTNTFSATVVCTADTTLVYYYCKGSVTATITDAATGAPIAGATLVVRESSGYAGFGQSLPAYDADASGVAVIPVCLLSPAGPNCAGGGALCVPATLCIGAAAPGYLSGPSAFFSASGGITNRVGGCAATAWTCGDSAAVAISLKPIVDPGGLAPVGVDVEGNATCYPALLDADACPSGLSALSYRDWGYVPASLVMTFDHGTNADGGGDRSPPYDLAGAEMHCLWDYDNVGIPMTWDGVHPWDNGGKTHFASGCLPQTSGHFCEFSTPSAPVQQLQSASATVDLDPVNGNDAQFTNYWKADCTTDAGSINDDCPVNSFGVWKYGSSTTCFTGGASCPGNPVLLAFSEAKCGPSLPSYGNAGTLTE